MKYVATLSYDNWIKFHNISAFVEGRKLLTDKDFDNDDDVEEEAKFDDEVEEWGDSDVEDFADTKQKIVKKINMKNRKKEIEKEKKINFFSDLTE